MGKGGRPPPPVGQGPKVRVRVLRVRVRDGPPMVKLGRPVGVSDGRLGEKIVGSLDGDSVGRYVETSVTDES